LSQLNKPFKSEKFRKKKPNTDEPVDSFLTIFFFWEGGSKSLVAVPGNNE
jgi:hypothetical protein